MNIRSVTSFLNVHSSLQDSDFRALRDLTRAARENFTHAGFPVQTTRLATQSLARIAPHDLRQFALDLASTANANDINYVSLGALPGDHPLMQSLTDAIASAESIFCSAHIASFENGIHLPAISNSARVV